jgi:lipoate-protein ligase A
MLLDRQIYIVFGKDIFIIDLIFLRNMGWRLIDTGYNNAFYNMAVDEALLELSRVPTLRFYTWRPAAVSLGCFQSVADINVEHCRNNNIDIVRRITGGKAVFHDNELTYSFVTVEKEMPSSIIESYKLISRGVLIALNNLGIGAKFKEENVKKSKTAFCLNNPSWYEITANNKKIAAAAQTRKNGKVLQHGPILIKVDYKRMCSVFRCDSEKLLNETRKRVTSLAESGTEVPLKRLKDELKKCFEENFGVRFVEKSLTKKEKMLAQKLAIEKYKTDEWNFRKNTKTI